MPYPPRALLFLAAAGAVALALLAAACGDDAAADRTPDASPDVIVADAPPSPDAAPDAAVVPRGARVLGLSVAIDDTDFPANAQLARDAGAQTTAVTFGWDEIERPYDGGAPDAAATTLFNPGVHVVNLVLSDRGLEATLALAAFDVGGSRAPADLAGIPLDDPAVGARYDALLDYAFSQIGDTKVTALVVATGADAWVAADAQRAAPLAGFVTHAAAHARTLRPSLKVGFSVDDVDRMAAVAPQLAAAWAASDFVGIDYVPVGAVTRGEAPATFVPADLSRMASLAPPQKPLLLRQAGYPSAPSAGPGASEESQALFVSAVFSAWDRAPDRFTAVVFRELVDVSPETASAIALRRGRSDAPFLALVQSLGIRARDGRDKQALSALRRAASSRGW